MGWFDDFVSDVGEAFEDAGEAIVGAAEDVVDFVGDAVETVVDTVGNVAESAVQVVTGTVESIVDLGQTVGGIISGEEGLEELGNWLGETGDRIIFDPIDTATGGAIDIDYEQGNFSAGVDFGVASAGVSFGENGFEADAAFDVGFASGSIGYDGEDGFSASGSLGVDFLPLPYAEAHVEISPTGEVSIGGELQANLPGLDLGASAEFERDDDGSWSLGGEVTAGDDLPFVDLDAHAGAEIGRNDDGNAYGHVEAGVSAEGPLGLHGSAEGSVDVVRGDGETLVDVFGEVEGGLGDREFEVGGGAHAEVSDQDIIDGVQGAAGTVGAVVDRVGDRVGDVVGAVGDRIGDTFDAVGGKVEDVLGAGPDTAGEFDSEGTGSVVVQNTVTEVEQAENAVAGVAAEVNSTMDDIIDNTAGVADTSGGTDDDSLLTVEPVQDFEQQIEAADAVDDVADDIWDGLEG